MRWPLHPTPLWEESLSSWLHRLTAAYDMTLDEWLEALFVTPIPDDFTLDTNPPAALIDKLIEGTGLSKERLYQMTLKSYTPWIIDGLEAPDQFNLYEDYFTQRFSVLPWPACKEKSCCRTYFNRQHVIPWLDRNTAPSLCVDCIQSDTIPYLRIFWRLALLGSCTQHKTLLTKDRIGWKKSLQFKNLIHLQPAPKSIAFVDRLSFQAITTGRVIYDNTIQFNAAVYCRWIRLLIEELFCGSLNREGIMEVWYMAGASYKVGLFDWEFECYESLNLVYRCWVLKVIGFILNELPTLIQHGKLDFSSRDELINMPKRINRQEILLDKYLIAALNHPLA